MRFGTAIANIHCIPSAQSEMTSQGLYGERVELLESANGWCRITNQRDGYSGFVPSDSLVADSTEHTHRVHTPSTPLFTCPNIKSPVIGLLPFSAELCISESDGKFLVTTNREYVWAAHTIERGKICAEDDLVTSAQWLFSGSPYLWGGRSVRGLDCSALVQLSAFNCGLTLPRDSVDQLQALPLDIAYHLRRRNDLLFWPGHVAIVQGPDTVFHATAHSLSCRTEPLEALEERAGKPVAIKRIQQEPEK